MGLMQVAPRSKDRRWNAQPSTQPSHLRNAHFTIEKDQYPSKEGATSSERSSSSESPYGEEEEGFSVSSLPPTSKRRKKDFKPPTPACTPEYPNRVIDGALEFLMDSVIPFSVFDNKRGPLLRLLHHLNPDVMGHLPGSKLLSGAHLDKYYFSMEREVKEKVKSFLQNGFATIIFDAFGDVLRSQFVNVLLKTEPSSQSGGQVVFLKTVYTGSKPIGAREYAQIIENLMEEYGGMEQICAVMSDSTLSCTDARDELTKKHDGLVAVNDQRHVADLLIEDVCRIPWIEYYVQRISNMARALYKRRNVRERYLTLMNLYNASLETHDNSETNTYRFEERNDTVTQGLGTTTDQDPTIVFEGYDDLPARTAMMLEKMKNPRFASVEQVLDAYLRSVKVLQSLMTMEDFLAKKFKPKNARSMDNFRLQFIPPLDDPQFKIATRQIDNIIFLLRRYRRFFDSNNRRISEVYPLTKELEDELDRLPLSQFLTEERRTELMTVFRRRKHGPLGRSLRSHLLDDIHYAAFLLDPNQAPRNPGSLKSHFHALATRYAAARGISDTSAWVSALMFKYACQVEKWYSTRNTVEGTKSLDMYKGNPLMWWNFASAADKELADFAVRTLSSSPSCSPVELSFTARKMLRYDWQKLLFRDKVQKLLFCEWNSKLKQNSDCSEMGFTKLVMDAGIILGRVKKLVDSYSEEDDTLAWYDELEKMEEK